MTVGKFLIFMAGVLAGLTVIAHDTFIIVANCLNVILLIFNGLKFDRDKE